MIVERIRAGMARARAQGKLIGRPAITAAQQNEITSRLASGATPYALAKELGLDRRAVERL
jgi:putative DNA-invertase from lambdoid prophage Rac